MVLEKKGKLEDQVSKDKGKLNKQVSEGSQEKERHNQPRENRTQPIKRKRPKGLAEVMGGFKMEERRKAYKKTKKKKEWL